MKIRNTIALLATSLVAAHSFNAVAEEPPAADLGALTPAEVTGASLDELDVDPMALETVAVQPVAFTTTATKRKAEVMLSQLSSADAPDAEIAGLFADVSLAVAAEQEAEGDGLDFAGSSTEADTNSITIGFGLGTLPLLQLQSPEKFKEMATTYDGLSASIMTLYSTEVAKASLSFVESAKKGAFDSDAYAAMLASATLGMVNSDDPSIQRRHGYLLVGLWMGFSVLSAATDSLDPSNAQIGDGLILMLVKDAQFDGSDKRLASIVDAAVTDIKAEKATASSLMDQAKKMMAVKADTK